MNNSIRAAMQAQSPVSSFYTPGAGYSLSSKTGKGGDAGPSGGGGKTGKSPGTSTGSDGGSGRGCDCDSLINEWIATCPSRSGTVDCSTCTSTCDGF